MIEGNTAKATKGLAQHSTAADAQILTQGVATLRGEMKVMMLQDDVVGDN